MTLEDEEEGHADQFLEFKIRAKSKMSDMWSRLEITQDSTDILELNISEE